MRTKIIENYSLSLVLVAFLTGCSNALYFYETEKISLTAEARPDSSQPVQGSLGIKQRVVLIAPKGENDDAVSAISSFSFKIIPEPGTPFNPVLIQTAFITGDAAACLTEIEAQKAAQAITLGSVQPPGADYSIMRNVVRIFEQSGTQEDAKHLSLLSGLGKSVIPTNYPVPIFRLDYATNTIKIEKPEGSLVNYSDIDSALSYWGELDGSAQKLESVLSAPDQYKFGDAPASNEMVKIGLKNKYEKTNKELKRIGQELAGNAIYTNALQYYIDKYIKKTVGD